MKICLLFCLLFNMHTPRNIQAPFVAADFWTQWNSVTPRQCLMIKVTSKAEFGSEVLAFTSNTRDMDLFWHPGITFKASPGITPTVIEMGLDEAPQLELTGVYNADSFTQTEVIAGKWNFAEIEVWSTSWNNPNLGELLHFRGNLGEFKDYQTYFTVEGRGLISRLSQDVNEVTQRLCRVKEFGDAQCGKDLTGTVVVNGTAYNIKQVGVTLATSGVLGTYRFDVSTFAGNIPADEAAATIYAQAFRNGKMTITSGSNAGVSREIADGTGATTPGYPIIEFYLKRPFPFQPAGGETVTLTMGCTRTLEDCMKFSNVVNRRAEDFVPGLESLNRLPSAN